MQTIKCINAALKSSEGWLYILILFSWVYPLLGLVNAVFLRVPGLDLIGPYMQITLYVCTIIFSTRAFVEKLKVSDVIFYFSICVIYLLQYILFPQNTKYLDDDALRFIFSVVPFYFIGLVLDHTKIIKMLFIASCIMILYRTYHDVFFVQDYIGTLGDGEHTSAMWQSYSTLPYVLYVWWYMFRKLNIWGIAFSVVGLILIVSYGNRGSLVCLISFVALYLLFFKHYRRKSLAYLIIVVISCLFVYFSNEIILTIGSLAENLGMSTRIIERFLNSDFLKTSDRDDLIDQLLPYMKDMGFFGYGINGYYPLIGTYPHKIHFDLWVSFGYFVGTLIMFVLAYMPYKVYKKAKDGDTIQLLLLFLILGIEPLFFSFSFISWPYFFLFIGFCVGRIRNVRLKLLL